MTTRNLQSGNNPVVIDVKVNDHQATRKLDQTRSKVNSLRGPFLGGALLGGFFGSSLLNIALKSGTAAQATDILGGAIGRLINQLGLIVGPALNAVANFLDRLDSRVRTVLIWTGIVLFFSTTLLTILGNIRLVLGIFPNLLTNFRLFTRRLAFARHQLSRLNVTFSNLRNQIQIVLNRMGQARGPMRFFISWALFFWAAGQLLSKMFATWIERLGAIRAILTPLRAGWVALIVVLAVLGILILDQIFGWGILDAILGKFGTSVEEVNKWIDEQIKRFITQARWLHILVGMFGLAALSMAWLGERTRELRNTLHDFAGWVIDNFIRGVGNAFLQLARIIAGVFNIMIMGYNKLAKLTGQQQIDLIKVRPDFEYIPWDERSAGRMWYEGGSKYGPPVAPIHINIYGDTYGIDDMERLMEDIWKNPNFQARVQGAP